MVFCGSGRRLDALAHCIEANGLEKFERRKVLSATTLRLIGILFLVSAACVAILNLKRVANLGMLWLSPMLLIIGMGLVIWSRRHN